MDEPSNEDVRKDLREWLYMDTSTNSQRGPVTLSLLIKMLEKGIGVSGSTLVWRAGMENWLTMAEAQEFKHTVQFQSAHWYFVDAEGQQRGPVISRMIMHKFREGDIDGLTLVYSALIGKWKKLTEVDALKEAISKIALEEQAAEAAAKIFDERSDKSKQVYFYDEDEGPKLMPALREGLTAPIDPSSSASSTKAEMKKSFTADSGLKYQWDEEENDWVEFEGPESDDDDDQTKNWKSKKEKESKKVKRKADDENEEEEEDDEEKDEEESADVTSEKNPEGVIQKRKRKKKQKKPKGISNWIYICGLPRDITLEEIRDHFSKMGIIAISAVDQLPKIKIYRDSNGDCKGDCALCYNAEGSLAMALEVLHEGYIRPGYQISVKKAEFVASGEVTNTATDDGTGTGTETQTLISNQFKPSRPKLSQAQVKVAKSAMRQALTWNEDDDMGLSKSKALKIVVLEGMFHPSDFSEESFSDELEGDVASECGKCGQIEKITVFSKNPKGVVIVKFTTSYASQQCVKLMDGRFFGGKKLRCFFWDGATDFTVVHGVDHEKEEEKLETSRLNEFGDWLDQDQEELPEEFRLNVER